MAGELFKKYYSRLAREGIIKSALVGMIVGFSTLFLTSIVLWLTNEDLFWLAFISGVAVGAVIAPVLYYKKFKPTTKEIARRVDELGLEERVLTMTELENDQSYIALRQREDTVAALQTVNAGLLSIVVSIPLIVATCVTGVFGVGMSVVTALSSAGVIESGREMIEEAMKPLPEYFDIEYEVSGEGGRILNFETEEEIPFQAVEKGKNAVLAHNGYKVRGDTHCNKVKESIQLLGRYTVVNCKRLHELEAHATTRKMRIRVGRIGSLRIEHRNGTGQFLIGHMVVAHNEIYAQRLGIGNLVNGLDATVEHYNKFHAC